MEAFFISIIPIFIIDLCSAKRYSGSGSSSNDSSSTSATLIPVILIPSIVVFTVIMVLIVCWKAKYGRTRRTGVLPLATQLALAQQEYQYAPPGFNQLPPPYGQLPPYNKMPPDEQPPPYPDPTAPVEPTKATRTS